MARKRLRPAALDARGSRRPLSGYQYRVLARLTIATHGDTCHLCGHGGATSADHVIPRSQGGADLVENCRPAHFHPCPTCGVRCQQVRGDRPLDEYPRTLVADAWIS